MRTFTCKLKNSILCLTKIFLKHIFIYTCIKLKMQVLKILKVHYILTHYKIFKQVPYKLLLLFLFVTFGLRII